jgi:lipopolysaccharide/colanic/teichoic acid biosynthesis glycosyltransferase
MEKQRDTHNRLRGSSGAAELEVGFAEGSPSSMERIVKRGFDIVVSLFALMFFSPIFVLVGLLVKLDSPGPVFYRGKRIGKDGKPFWMYKFRTMRDVPIDTGPRVTACDDPRITHLGRILRDTKLNEFPQFLNVLKGDMSLVGPRPEDPKFVALYTRGQRQVLSVIPGITSMAAILYRDEESMLCQDTLEDTYVNVIMPDKINLDLEYIRHGSFLVDLEILFRTVLVLSPRFARAAPDIEELLFGPVQTFVRRHLSWFTLDLLLSAGAVLVTNFIWWCASRPFHPNWLLNLTSAIGISLIFTFMNQIWGLQRHAWSCARGQEAIEVFLSTASGTLTVLAINALGFGLPPEMLLLCGGIAATFFIAARYRSRLIAGILGRWSCLWRKERQQGQKRVLIVGAGELGQFCARWAQHRPETRGYRVVGFADDDLTKRGIHVQGVRVLGTSRTVPLLVSQHAIDVVIVAMPDLAARECASVLDNCRQLPVRVEAIPDFLGFMGAPSPSVPTTIPEGTYSAQRWPSG